MSYENLTGDEYARLCFLLLGPFVPELWNIGQHGSKKWSWCINSGTVKKPNSSAHPGLLLLILDAQWPINYEKPRLSTAIIVALQKRLEARL